MQRCFITMAILIALASVLVLAGCGGKRADTSLAGAAEGVTEAELTQELMKTFAELGIDPNKVVSGVPSRGSLVFDLSATLADADGPGGAPATGANLAWTEQFYGDYDSNSEAGWPDIQPLAQYVYAPFSYARPDERGGCEFWPAGDPEGSASERYNWRLARIDADHTGMINTADIVALALAFHDRMLGYHVYQRGPGEADFVLAATLEHPHRSSIPVRYHWDCSFTEAGVYEFYVAPYGTAGQDGQSSPLYRIDTEAGTVNSRPVAIFGHCDYWMYPNVTSAHPGQEVLFDASGSYDWDSGIASFLWDFDGDGIIDWDSAEEPPAASSNGQVTSIKPLYTDGMVKVVYSSLGSGELEASVTVRDNAGWDSEPELMRVELHE